MEVKAPEAGEGCVKSRVRASLWEGGWSGQDSVGVG